MRRALMLLTLAVGVGTASAGSAAHVEPVLRSADETNGHVVAAFTVGDLQPGLIEVALRPERGRSGSFVAANVKLVEGISGATRSATGVLHVRTRKALPRRVYYVHVSGFETDGVTDCKPGLPCLVHWSNVLRVAPP